MRVGLLAWGILFSSTGFGARVVTTGLIPIQPYLQGTISNPSSVAQTVTLTISTSGTASLSLPGSGSVGSGYFQCGTATSGAGCGSTTCTSNCSCCTTLPSNLSIPPGTSYSFYLTTFTGSSQDYHTAIDLRVSVQESQGYVIVTGYCGSGTGVNIPLLVNGGRPF